MHVKSPRACEPCSNFAAARPSKSPQTISQRPEIISQRPEIISQRSLGGKTDKSHSGQATEKWGSQRPLGFFHVWSGIGKNQVKVWEEKTINNRVEYIALPWEVGGWVYGEPEPAEVRLLLSLWQPSGKLGRVDLKQELLGIKLTWTLFHVASSFSPYWQL